MPEFNGGVDIIIKRLIKESESVVKIQRQLRLPFLFHIKKDILFKSDAYERILNEESAIGISVLLPIDNNIKNIIDYYISPYYRMYFGKKYAAGFFIEGFGMLNSIQNNYSLFSSNGNNKTTDFALGLSVGGKWITKRGFIGEINYGLGRNLFNANESNIVLVFKVGVNIGYRF